MHDHDAPHKDAGGVDLSRRGFIKGAGAVAAAPLVVPALLHAADDGPADPNLQRCGPGETACDLTINGKRQSVRIEPRVTLLELLRDKLDMTGSKQICDRGACGGCTVLLDGKPVNSCLMLAMDAVGHKIVTIEGLSRDGQLDRVQEAFVRHDAMQCGYCTPGLVVSVVSLLMQNARPTLDDVKRGCAGNICRCGTYPKVFDAALATSGTITTIGNIADNKGKALENELPRVDAELKVTGKAKYTADMNLPNMAFASVVYCPYGRARLKSFDEAAARKIKGVLDVSITKRKKYLYCGQPTGHVCAENRQSLDDAIAALNMKWEILEPAVDPVAEHKKSFGPLPPSLDDAGDEENASKAKKAFESAKHTVEATYSTQIQTHSSLEPHAAVADYRGETAEFWCSSQALGLIHDGAADAFDLPKDKVRAHCEFVGGGFGSKFSIDTEGRLAADLSKKLARPVKVVNDRKREHLDTGCRPGSIQCMKIALDEKGMPTGGHVHVAGVGGPGGGSDAANPSRYQFGPLVRTFNNVELSVGAARPMRAPGHPQGMFAVDSFADELAAKAGIDPLEYRKKIDPNEIRHAMYDWGAAKIGWDKRPRPDGSGKGRLRYGCGVGVGDWFNMPGRAQIRVEAYKDGTIKVLSGTQDIGTGNRTVLADVVADHLKLPRKLITADCGNSDYPPGPASGGSTTCRTIVPAIRDAAEKLKRELKKQTDADFSGEDSWLAACRKIKDDKISVLGSFNRKYWGSGSSEAVQFATVEVDTGTGVVRVTKVLAMQNVGQAVNRLTVENQIIGGVIQGVSYALFEDKILDPTTGAMVNPNVEEYKILGPRDCPQILPVIWKQGDDLGARSLGEPPVIPTAGAVANAVANALGVRVRSLPITPAKVLAALAGKAGA